MGETRSGTILALCALAASAACTPGFQARPELPRGAVGPWVVPLEHAWFLNRIEIPVTLNGAGPFAFVVDTTSQTSNIDAALVAELRLPVTESRTLKVRDASGQVRPYAYTSIDALGLGTLTLARANLGLTPVAATAAKRARVRGLLGLNVLAGLRLTIDRAHGVLVLEPSGGRLAPESGLERVELPLQRLDVPAGELHAAPVRLSGAGQNVATALLVDTGAPQTSLAPRFARPEDGRPVGLPFDGQFRLDALSLGASSVERVDVAPADGPVDDRAPGRLAMDVLGRFRTTVDLGAGRLVLERPRIVTPAAAGTPASCVGWEGGEASPVACFSPRFERLGDDRLVVQVVPEVDVTLGADVSLALVDARGATLETPWRLGVSLQEARRGVPATFALLRRSAEVASRGVSTAFPFDAVAGVRVTAVRPGRHHERLVGRCLWLDFEEGGKARPAMKRCRELRPGSGTEPRPASKAGAAPSAGAAPPAGGAPAPGVAPSAAPAAKDAPAPAQTAPRAPAPATFGGPPR